MPSDLHGALLALSPLDGRYAEKVQALVPHFSEFALIRSRVRIEVEYFRSLVEQLANRPMDREVANRLEGIIADFSLEEAAEVKRIERTTNHDVKAVEYFLKDRLRTIPGLESELEKVHFGLTSEDVNNLAYACMIQTSVQDVMLPALGEVIQALRHLADATKQIPMLARTHGQPASPTTMGKEIAVFLKRLVAEMEGLRASRLTGKLNGATGTFGAHCVAYPEVDWPAFATRFIQRLGLVPNLVTTQIEPHDGIAELCDRLRRINNILLDLDQDFWRYISEGYFRQKVVATEVGSSAMPHKVNPIDFENSEGNLGVANALCFFMSEKLPKSRLQRDLSDSTVLRNLGVAFGHSLLAYQSTLKGLQKLYLDAERLRDDLSAHPEVLAEAYQTVLRAQGYELPYERLKELTRGERVSLEAMRDFGRSLEIDASTKERILGLSPEGYVGVAPELTELALSEADALLHRLQPGGVR